MVNVYDVTGAADAPSEQLEKLAEAVDRGDVAEADGEAIRACWQRLKENGLERGEDGWQTPSAQETSLKILRLSAKRADGRLIDFDAPSDLRALMAAHEDAGAEANNTKRNYAATLRTFFRFLDSEPDRPAFGWISDYRPPKKNTDKKDPAELLGDEDVEAIRRKLRFRRDKAFVELLADTGLRRTAACQLRVGDLDLDAEPEPEIRINPEGEAQKGAEDHDMDAIDLKDSAVHLRGWVREDHPEAPEPPDDAPLFPVVEGYDAENREDCAAHPVTLQDQIRDAADAAGVDKPVNLHGFRHAAVKRWKLRYGMSWEAIRDRALWSDSALAEMMETYGKLDAEERREQVREQMGSEVDRDSEPATRECGGCGREIPPTANYCPGCGRDPDKAPGETDKRDTRTFARAIAAGVKVAAEGEPADDISEEEVERIVSTIENDGHQGTAAYDALAGE